MKTIFKNLSNFNNEDGISIVLIFILLSVILILGGVLSQTSIIQYRNAVREEKKVQADYLAKSGANMIASAIEESKIDPDELAGKTSTGNSLSTDTAGTFDIEVNKNGNTYEIISTANVDNYNSTVTIELTKETSTIDIPPIDVAAFADAYIKFLGGKINGDVGTNSNANSSIEIDWATIIGDAFAGPEADISQVLKSPDWNTIQGIINNLPTSRNYTLPDFPDFPDNLPRMYSELIVGDNDEVTISSDVWYDKITVESNGILNLEVDNTTEDLDIRIGELKVLQNGEVNIIRTHPRLSDEEEPENRVNIYVDDYYQQDNGGRFNNGGNPEDVYMNYAGTKKFSLVNDAKFGGSIFSDNADIEVTNGATIKGNITSGHNNITLDGGTHTDVKVIYAPESDVHLGGSAQINGSIISNSINTLEGANPNLTYTGDVSSISPEDLGFEVLDGYSRIWK